MGTGTGLTATPVPLFLSLVNLLDENCPYYLAMGMSYDEYWNGDIDLIKIYRSKSKIENERTNYNAWLHGRYVYDALVAVAPALNAFSKKPKPIDYLSEPYKMANINYDDSRLQEDTKEIHKSAVMFEQFANMYNKSHIGKVKKEGDDILQSKQTQL